MTQSVSHLEQQIASLLASDERIEYERMVDQACEKVKDVPLRSLEFAAGYAHRNGQNDAIIGLLVAVIARRTNRSYQ